MKILLWLFLCASPVSVFAHEPAKPRARCECTCVVKGDDDKYETRKGDGKDREAAGDSLKKALGKKKCELSPDCKGSC